MSASPSTCIMTCISFCTAKWSDMKISRWPASSASGTLLSAAIGWSGVTTAHSGPSAKVRVLQPGSRPAPTHSPMSISSLRSMVTTSSVGPDRMSMAICGCLTLKRRNAPVMNPSTNPSPTPTAMRPRSRSRYSSSCACSWRTRRCCLRWKSTSVRPTSVTTTERPRRSSSDMRSARSSSAICRLTTEALTPSVSAATRTPP